MPIAVVCVSCRKELDEPGGVILSPPDEMQRVTKYHACVKCFEYLNHLFYRMKDGTNGRG